MPAIGALVACGYVVTALSLFSSCTAQAQRRQWPVERFDRCMRVTGNDALDPDNTYSTLGCDTSRDSVVSAENDPGHVTFQTSVIGARNKDQANLAFVGVAFGSRWDRTDAYVGNSQVTSGGAGFLGYRAATVLVGDARIAVELSMLPSPAPRCSYVSRGAISGQSCTYIEAAQFQLTPAMLDDIQRRFAADPNATFQMKLFTDTSANFILQIPVSEIEAVRRRVFPSAPTAP